jgi:ribosomal protein S27E
MSHLQRFFLAIVPRGVGKAMEKESRLWMLRCPSCGHETSVWDAGGIRYLAHGQPQRRFRCLICGPQWHTLYKKDAPVAA